MGVNFVITSTKCYAPVITLKHTTKKNNNLVEIN